MTASGPFASRPVSQAAGSLKRSGGCRIVESDLLPGVGALTYVIDSSACQAFEVDRESVWLSDPQETWRNAPVASGRVQTNSLDSDDQGHDTRA